MILDIISHGQGVRRRRTVLRPCVGDRAVTGSWLGQPHEVTAILPHLSYMGSSSGRGHGVARGIRAEGASHDVHNVFEAILRHGHRQLCMALHTNTRGSGQWALKWVQGHTVWSAQKQVGL